LEKYVTGESATTNCSSAWHDEHEDPTEKGWYLVDAVDGRFDGERKYRAWGNGSWWIPLADGWLSSPMGLYRWQGPVADIDGPAPDGTNPK
jgi:hypothetical protein